MSRVRVGWLTVYLDLPPESFAPSVAYWSALTGYAVSPARGRHDEYASLLPPGGADDHLAVQRLGSGPGRLHLDLHVADPAAAAEEAVGLGARVLARPTDGYVVLESPGGFVFCLVSHPQGRAAAPAAWPGGRSMVDQVCLDIPADGYERETAFWSALTAWELTASAGAEFRRLRHQPGLPVRILLQRLAEPTGRVRAHLDLAADDRAAEVARHEALGGRVLARRQWWTVLADPAGTAYCVTGRTPTDPTDHLTKEPR
ncbi:VOC family protein [Nocardioides pantholopis]|uniref:VOC family protein n=1 Tax=Nocardioides pantholopis TaxID=2483798 RepID=UPI0019D1B4DF|nr:VOC family protein [Nocardioides pantholopis]